MSRKKYQGYIYHASFDDPLLSIDILADMPDADAYEVARNKVKPPKNIAPELYVLYSWPTLNKDQECHLFRKLNYCRYHIALQSGDADILGRIEEDTFNFLVSANLRLAVHIAKKFAHNHPGFDESLSEANLAIIMAINRYDFSRGPKFSTYAVWSAVKNTATVRQNESKKESKIDRKISVDLMTQESEAGEGEESSHYGRLTHSILSYLEPRERKIMMKVWGIDPHPVSTLEMIGKEMNLSKERIRQLRNNISLKIKSIASKIENFEEIL